MRSLFKLLALGDSSYDSVPWDDCCEILKLTKGSGILWNSLRIQRGHALSNQGFSLQTKNVCRDYGTSMHCYSHNGKQGDWQTSPQDYRNLFLDVRSMRISETDCYIGSILQFRVRIFYYCVALLHLAPRHTKDLWIAKERPCSLAETYSKLSGEDFHVASIQRAFSGPQHLEGRKQNWELHMKTESMEFIFSHDQALVLLR